MCLYFLISLFLYIFIYLFIRLFLHCFSSLNISSILYVFIFEFLDFLISHFFISLFALDIQLVVPQRDSPLGLTPPSPDSIPTGEELWEALKCDPVDKQRVELLLESRAPVNFREPGSPQVSYEKNKNRKLC